MGPHSHRGLVFALVATFLIGAAGSAGAGLTSTAGPASDCSGGPGTQRSDRSADGRYVAFTSSSPTHVSGDTNLACDVFVKDRRTNKVTRVSVASDGSQADFGVVLMPQPVTFPESINPRISADGRRVTFDSAAADLVDGDTNMSWDTFVHDRQKALTTLKR